MIFAFFLVIEFLAAILATPTSIIFLAVIYISKEVQFKWRFALFLFFLAAITISVAHIFRLVVFFSQFGLHYNVSYFLIKDHENLAFFVTIASHLQSTSVLLFALVQLLTIYLSEHFLNSVYGNILFCMLSVVTIVSSITLAYFTILTENSLFQSISVYVVYLVDFISFVIFLFVHQVSQKRYKQKLGTVTLEKKYQTSQVINWSKTMIPSMMIAKTSRIVSLIMVMQFFDIDSTGETDAIYLSIIHILMDSHIIFLVLSIIVYQKKLRKGFSSTSSDMRALQTLNGDNIKMDATGGDYTKYLNKQWK